MSPIFLFVILSTIVVLAALSAVISGMEAAFFALQPHQLRRLREEHPKGQALFNGLIENPRRFLSMILLADALANLPLCLLCLFALREINASLNIPFWASAMILFAIIVVVCDLAPKVIAARSPFRTASLTIGFAQWLRLLFQPLAGSLESFSEKFADLLTPRSVKARTSLSGDELEIMAQVGAEEGSLHAIESEMIQEILKLRDKTAKDCMTPRVEMFTIADDLTNEQATEEFRSQRVRRLPVYGETRDDIVGILDARRFLTRQDAALHYTEIMDPPSFVPDTMKALDLLRSFLKHPQGLALVLDEFGGVEGVVTFTDLVEEIISDAVPRSDQGLYIERMPDGKFLVSGSARLDDLGEELGVELEEEGVDTIQGLIFNRLGHLPKPGTTVDIHGLNVLIRRTTRKRIGELMISKREEGDAEPEVKP